MELSFFKISKLRSREETIEELKSQFVEASRIGGGTEFKQRRTRSGIKDTFQGFFADQIQAIATKKGILRVQKEREIDTLKSTFPSNTTSPVWRIHGMCFVILRSQSSVLS
ncbi:hypothetical protein EV360DRAFT_51056 [Lentinula raphanica]|nr:hypothetical protein EV360DRAFT_51056 [Lentinula raphanica]